MTVYIATPHAQAVNLMMTAVFAMAIGLVLLMAGRHQRRMASSVLASGSAMRVGDRLVERPSTSKTRRTSGLVIIVLSVPFLIAGAVYLLGGLLLLVY